MVINKDGVKRHFLPNHEVCTCSRVRLCLQQVDCCRLLPLRLGAQQWITESMPCMQIPAAYGELQPPLPARVAVGGGGGAATSL